MSIIYKMKSKFDKIQELAENGFLCEVVTDGWANWKFDEEFGIPLIETAKPAHIKVDDFDDIRQVGYRGCYWFFNEEGKLIQDDVGMYPTFEEAIDTLFETYETIKDYVDKKGFKIYKK